ncbi:MAG TPA: hypothetical protein VMW06_07050 [Desulfobacterales bacterium]|nr:hypothetical protein [Desulfobacterales bacterium]
MKTKLTDEELEKQVKALEKEIYIKQRGPKFNDNLLPLYSPRPKTATTITTD